MSKKIWSTLLHLGTNFWYEEGNTRGQDELKLWKSPASSNIRFDRTTWDEYLKHIITVFFNYWSIICKSHKYSPQTFKHINHLYFTFIF